MSEIRKALMDMTPEELIDTLHQRETAVAAARDALNRAIDEVTNRLDEDRWGSEGGN